MFVVELDLGHLKEPAPSGLIPQTNLERTARVLLSDEDELRARWRIATSENRPSGLGDTANAPARTCARALPTRRPSSRPARVRAGRRRQAAHRNHTCLHRRRHSRLQPARPQTPPRLVHAPGRCALARIGGRLATTTSPRRAASTRTSSPTRLNSITASYSRRTRSDAFRTLRARRAAPAFPA